MMTGVSMPRLRSSRSTSKPFSRGSITSSSTRSNASPAARSSPLSPSPLVSTSIPFARQPIAQRQHEAWLVFDEEQPLHARGSVRLGQCRAPDRLFTRGGKHDRELAARSGRAPHADASAVRFDDALDQAQAEAGALDLRRDDVGGAIERLEDPALIGRRDADAAIGDRDVHLAPGVARANADPAALPRRT